MPRVTLTGMRPLAVPPIEGFLMPADSTIQDTDTSKVWKMIQNIDICMFVTQDASEPRARPMSTIAKEDRGIIFILTEATSSAAQDVNKNSTVLLTYQGSTDHVAVAGTAEVVDDVELVKTLWNPGAQAFWPDGPEASSVVAIKVNPGRADYWDGPNRVVASAKFLFSLITKQEPDMGDRGVVNL